jgi:Fe-coproporphyrin III synthase
MMIVANYRGLARLLIHKPGVVATVAVQNGWGRLIHKFRNGHHDGMSPAPEQVTVVVTDVCNLRCKMCQYAYSESPGYQLNRAGKMPPQLFYKLMDEIPGRPLVSFTGGEPLLHPSLPDFIAHARSMGRPTTLTTNGWMLARRAKELADAALDFLVVSVDGPPEIHNRIRGKNSFERLREGIREILRLPRRPFLFMSMAISDLNYEYLIPMFERAKRWGVDGINFNHLWMQTDRMVEAYNTRLGLIFEADEVSWEVHPEKVDGFALAADIDLIRSRIGGDSFIVLATPYLEGEDIVKWYGEPETMVRWTRARCAWTRMKVWPDGKVKPCRDWAAGDIGRQDAMEVWNGLKYRQFRRLLAAEKVFPICARCCYMAHP